MILFIADLFIEDVIGGAELTSESLIQNSSLFIKKVHSHQVSKTFINQHKEDFWIFGNFVKIPENLLIYISQNINYAVIEYDYKFCKWRSQPKHQFLEDECKCPHETRGKLISIFYHSAKSLWFMSEEQKKIYYEYFPFLKKKSFVLSSNFTDETLGIIQNLKKDTPEKDDKWLILNSQSWIKGLADCVRYARKNNLNYELVGGLSYVDMLKKLSQSRGLIFMPKAHDTCPRIVIEAKLLGCKLILNENVQHKNEEWFTTSEKMVNHFRERKKFFWNEILSHIYINHYLKEYEGHSKNDSRFVIVVPTYNSEEWIKKTIESVKNQTHQNFLCYIINDCSTDNTLKAIENQICDDKKFILINNNERLGSPIGNMYNCLKQNKVSLNDDDIIVNLDGDDWFINENVLSYVSDFYNKEKCELTYGSFVRFSNGIIGQESTEYPSEVVKNSSYRQDIWRASHLRTFKYGLFKKIQKHFITDNEGNFYKYAADQALMFSLLELSTKSKFIDKVMYVYNDNNPLGIDPRTRSADDSLRKLEAVELLKIKQLRSHA
tara:strand:+ start:1168 stop:2814 length:1647 start_codon:yes stop_codon:yes gene_type:complete